MDDNNNILQKMTVLLLIIIFIMQQNQMALITSFYKTHFSMTSLVDTTKRNRFQLVQTILKEGYYFRQPRRIWMRVRSRAYWPNILKYADEEYWLSTFRMTSDTFLYICDELRDYLKPAHNPFHQAREPIAAEEQVAICLYYLASGSLYRVVGDVFGIHKSTVCVIVHKVCNKIVEKLMQQWITIPDEHECEEISERFRARCGLPRIILAIDGSHIPVTPPSNGRTDFTNRKGWPSVVLQAAVDDRLLFRNINCQTPGCSHDAWVFKNSNLYVYYEDLLPQTTEMIEGVNVPYLVVGDPAYPLLPWLMKDFTYTSKITKEQDTFNVYLNRARVVVEIAFGRLKARWRVLFKRMDVNVQFAPTVISACCVLHNIIESKESSFRTGWLAEGRSGEQFEQPETLDDTSSNSAAEKIRCALSKYVHKNLPPKKSLRWNFGKK